MKKQPPKQEGNPEKANSPNSFQEESQTMKVLRLRMSEMEREMRRLEETIKEKDEQIQNLKGHNGSHWTKFRGNLEKYSSIDFYRRKLTQYRMSDRSEKVDEFGLDPVYRNKVRPFFDFLMEQYWRVTAIDIENVPYEGRALLIANHSGLLPFDGAMIATVMTEYHPKHRIVRPLIDDFVFHFPFLSPFMTRIGCVRACQENAERLLSEEQLVVAFPEGIKGNAKNIRERYRLQRFGRGGFVKLAIRTRSPIIPVAVVGAEEIYPIIARLDFVGKAMGFPVGPVTPFFPLLGPIGMIPLPTKWYLHFGAPIDMSQYPLEAQDDEILINELKEDIRSRIQGMVNELLMLRKSIWFG